jgi:sirohydrochlorin cobaltochelatase
VLLIGHGSRDEEGNEEFRRFAEELSRNWTGRRIESCFLELAEPDIPSAVRRCWEMGARRVVAVPMILLAASHVKQEIPELLEEARVAHPGLEIVYGHNVGLHPRLLDLLDARYRETVADWTEGDPDGTAIVLLGRGSSDMDANGDLYKLGRILWERTGALTVEVCFAGITDPRLPEGVGRTIRLGARRVVVIPYFLFTGVLMKRMQHTLTSLQAEWPHIPMRMAPHFGLHPFLLEAVRDRIEEAALIGRV